MKTFEHKRGDSFRKTLRLTDLAGDPIDASDPEVWTIASQLRYRDEDSTTHVIDFTFAPEDLAAGDIILDIPLDDSQTMVAGDWKGDVEVTKLTPLYRRSTETFVVNVTADVTHGD